mmetsp:Transcript_78566/g.141721  ORF Transcript_78566/g.141721 Transcript_78566/m.141721 type:complete len:227 (-) Transcript_78566:349-1029(-)
MYDASTTGISSAGAASRMDTAFTSSRASNLPFIASYLASVRFEISSSSASPLRDFAGSSSTTPGNAGCCISGTLFSSSGSFSQVAAFSATVAKNFPLSLRVPDSPGEQAVLKEGVGAFMGMSQSAEATSLWSEAKIKGSAALSSCAKRGGDKLGARKSSLGQSCNGSLSPGEAGTASSDGALPATSAGCDPATPTWPEARSSGFAGESGASARSAADGFTGESAPV